MSRGIPPVKEYNIIDMRRVRDVDVSKGRGRQFDRRFPYRRSLVHLSPIKLGEECRRGRSKASLVAVANDQSILPIVHQKAGVVGNIGPTSSCARITERRLASPGISAQQDSASLELNAGRMNGCSERAH